MMSVYLGDIGILNIKGSDYCCIITEISKSEAINSMQNTDLTKKSWKTIKQKNLLPCVKLGKEVLTFGDIEIEKNKFSCKKIPIFLKDADIKKVLVSNKIPFGGKKL